MKRVVFLIFTSLLVTACGAKKNPTILSTLTNPTNRSSDYEQFIDITENAPDETYALQGDNPVRVGEKSVANQRRYIASLAGPNGEELTFHRRGSCCAYKSENGYGDFALVDVYEVMYEGLKKPVLLYITFYDDGPLYIPHGFTKRNLR